MPRPKKYHPFTKEQIQYFFCELQEAGSVDELMLKKEAIVKNEGKTFIAMREDIEAYKEKHLIGIYESLWDEYKITIPYVFWSRLYDKLTDAEKETI